jgi:hypothetical protein
MIGVIVVEAGPVPVPPLTNKLCCPERALADDTINVEPVVQVLHPVDPDSKPPLAIKFGNSSEEPPVSEVEPVSMVSLVSGGTEVGSDVSPVGTDDTSDDGSSVVGTSDVGMGSEVEVLEPVSVGLTTNVSVSLVSEVGVSVVDSSGSVVPPPPLLVSVSTAASAPPSNIGISGTESSSEHPKPDTRAKPTAKPN